jgi:hypothetical protein
VRVQSAPSPHKWSGSRCQIKKDKTSRRRVGVHPMAYLMWQPLFNDTRARPLLDSHFQRDPDAYRLLCRGQTVAPERLPSLIRVETGHTVLPDFFSVHSGIWGVSEKARDVLQSAAPSDFEFYPFSAENVRGFSVRGQYYFMNVISHRNAVIWDKSTVKVEKAEEKWGGHMVVDIPPYPEPGMLSLDESKILGVDAWHDEMQGSAAASEIFVSDRLQKIIDAAGLKPIRFSPVAEI